MMLGIGLWLVVAASAASAAAGWRRLTDADVSWWRRVLLALRDVGLVAGALLVAVHLTDDALPLGDARVTAHAATAVDLLVPEEVDTDALRAALSVVSEADLEVQDVTDDEVGSFDRDVEEQYWEVSGPLGGASCVQVSTRTTTGGYGPVVDATTSVTPGSCDDD